MGGRKWFEEFAGEVRHRRQHEQGGADHSHIYLAGMGGTFVYILPGLDRRIDALMFGAMSLCLYFVCLGLFLARKAFFISDYPSPYQEAANLLERPDLSLDEVRHGEILNLADRLQESKNWIEGKAKAINRVRLALILSPLAFVCGCFAFKTLG
jgi:hypothetical protein